MCKTCVLAVYTLLKNRGAGYILCAGRYSRVQQAVANRQVTRLSPHQNTPYFSTHKTNLFDLFNVYFSTLSTEPITNTIIYKK